MERRGSALWLCLAIVVACSGVRCFDDEETMSRTLPAYAIALNAHLLNATDCQRDLRIFRDAVDQRVLWALKVLDSSGEMKPGFLYGNNYWLGIKSQCFDTMNRSPMIISEETLRNNSRYRKVEEEFPPYDVNYFSASFRHNSTLQYHIELPEEDLIILGLCLPATCSSNELAVILNKIFHNRSLLANDLYAADFRLTGVRDLRDNHQWLMNGKYFIIALLFILTLIMMIIGTIYDVCVHQNYLKAQKEFYDPERQKTVTYGGKLVLENTEVLPPGPRRESLFWKIAICYSVYTNSKILFDTKLSAEGMPIIHGMKFLGMMWIILIHTIFFMASFTENKPMAYRKTDDLASQVVANSILSVDTFFFISGFLITYLYLSAMGGKKEQRKVNYSAKATEFFLVVLRRFLRLTPAYMMMLGIAQLNFGWYAQTSEFYISENPYETCDKYWWRNLLYINNLFSRKEMCLSWSWYISNDMQFFIIGSFLTILSTIYFNVAVIVLLSLLCGSIFITGYLSYSHGYVPTLDQQFLYLDLLYDPPWTRIAPHIVGMITGYILVKLNKKLNLKKGTVALCWCLGSSCNILVLFGLWNRYLPVGLAAVYVGFNRFIWAVGLGWVVIACSTNRGGIINTVLSFKAWVPLSRLTYCAYLVNPFVIYSTYSYNETPTHIDLLSNGSNFLGFMVVSYICAYAITLMFETPYILLMRMLMKTRDNKT